MNLSFAVLLLLGVFAGPVGLNLVTPNLIGLLDPGDTVLGLRLDQGGHLTHGSPVNASGKLYNFVSYGVTPSDERIDLDQVRDLALEHRPKLIVTGATAYPRIIDPAPFRAIADEVGALFMFDAAHIAGLVAGGAHPNPVGVADIVTLTEIPAPPFKETRRAAKYLELLRQTGLTSVEQDAEGNVMGVRKGTGGGPLLAVAAHLDTVFPEGTDVTVKRTGTRLAAPGIGDDTRSLAVLLALIRAMNEAGVATAGDILFVGNVGEEGPGDLRGVKQLFLKGKYKDQIKMFVSIDGTGKSVGAVS